MEKNTLESALKEFSQTSGTNANDVKEFFALMSDGSIKRMPKEDMATVLGGLLKSDGYLCWKKTQISIDNGKSVNIPNVHGLLVMQNKYINDGIANIYSCGQISVIPVFEHKVFSIDMSINNNILTITNRYGTVFTAQIEYQDLSY